MCLMVISAMDRNEGQEKEEGWWAWFIFYIEWLRKTSLVVNIWADLKKWWSKPLQAKEYKNEGGSVLDVFQKQSEQVSHCGQIMVRLGNCGREEVRELWVGGRGGVGSGEHGWAGQVINGLIGHFALWILFWQGKP